MLVIPMWLEVYFPQDRRKRSNNTFYYSPVTKQWWRFGEDMVLEHIAYMPTYCREIKKRSDLTKITKYLREHYDPEGLWSARSENYYRFACLKDDIVFQRYCWGSGFLGNDIPWKRPTRKIRSLRYLDMNDLVTSEIMRTKHANAYIWENSHVYNTHSYYSRSPDAPSKIDIEGVIRFLDDEDDLFWRWLRFERVGKLKDKFRCTIVQWRFFGTKEHFNRTVDRPSVITYKKECDVSAFVPKPSENLQTRKDKMKDLFWYNTSVL